MSLQGSYRDVVGPPTMPISSGEAEMQQLPSTCLGPAGHFGPITVRLRPLDRAVPIMGPGATVGPVETRVHWARPL